MGDGINEVTGEGMSYKAPARPPIAERIPIFQVMIRIKTGEKDCKPIYEWRAMRPSGGSPYQFATRAEAETALRLTGDDVRFYPENYRIEES